MCQVPGHDPAFMEAINKNMRVPERLSVVPGQRWREEEEEEEEPLAAYVMQVPDRLTYTEAPDMSPRPLFTLSKPVGGPLGLEPCWESPPEEAVLREGSQSSMRRSYSDQSFGRTPPGTPTHKQALVPSRHPSSFRGSGPPLHQRAAPPPPLPVLTSDPEAQRPPLGLLSPQFLLQTARQLGLQASQRLLQTISHKYRFNNQEKPSATRGPTQVPAAALVESSRTRVVDSWSPEDDGGAAVEFIILRRQVMKMSRRLAALEKQSCDQRNTEALLFSLLFSTCLLNMWLWIRR